MVRESRKKKQPALLLDDVTQANVGLAGEEEEGWGGQHKGGGK